MRRGGIGLSINVGESELSFSLDGTTFSILGGERPIDTPARDMCIKASDMPAMWVENPVKVLDQPRFGQRDYAIARFTLRNEPQEKATVAFETVVYKDQRTAGGVLEGTLSKMAFLRLSKVEVGDAGAMIEVAGQTNRMLRAVVFVERNVLGLILLSCEPSSKISDSWLISMARLMVSRMK